MKTRKILPALIIIIACMTLNAHAFSNGPGNFQGKTILLIVGDDNGTVLPGQGTGDLFIRNRLEKVLGHKVIIGIDSASREVLLKATASADLVIVSESPHSMKLQNKLKTVKTPVLSYEAFIQDEMGLTTTELPGDPGEPEEFNYGVRNKDTLIDIIKPGHPLAAGLNGQVKVYNVPKQVTWGKVGKNAEVIATLAGKKEAATIYIYDKGDELFDGTIAAGMRIGFFLEEENKTGSSTFLTKEGLQLFDACVKYALERGKD